MRTRQWSKAGRSRARRGDGHRRSRCDDDGGGRCRRPDRPEAAAAGPDLDRHAGGHADAPRRRRSSPAARAAGCSRCTRTCSTASRSRVPPTPRPRSRGTRASRTSRSARTLHAVEIAPNGILRTSAWAAHQAGYTGVTTGGTPVRIAIVDTGIKLDHVDLAANIDPASASTASTPASRRTTTRGTARTSRAPQRPRSTAQGVVGMATNAQLIPVKVLDSTGFGTDAQVICGLDYVAALAQSQPGPYVVNMSLGDPEPPGRDDLRLERAAPGDL